MKYIFRYIINPLTKKNFEAFPFIFPFIKSKSKVVRIFSYLKHCSKRFANKASSIQLKAFSLLEIAISLMIIGVLTMAVIKGQDILYAARLDKTAMQIEAIQLSIETARTSGVSVDSIEQLIETGFLNKKQSIPAIGGKFFIKKGNADPQGDYILLAKDTEDGILKKKDAENLKFKIDGDAEGGTTHIQNDNNLYKVFVEIA